MGWKGRGRVDMESRKVVKEKGKVWDGKNVKERLKGK